MTIPEWPFVRQQPGGFVDTVDIPVAAQLNAWDEQLSRAADGDLWSDAVLVKNFEDPKSLFALRSSMIYDGGYGIWLLCGINTGPVFAISHDGAKTWDSYSPATAGIPTDCSPHVLITNGAGALLVAYKPNSANTVKGAFSTDVFTTSSQVVVGGSNTLAPVAGYYSARLNLWFLTFDDGSLYSAPSPAGFWTLRVNVSVPIYGFCESGDRIAVVTDTGAVLVSLDGLSWAGSTSPAGSGQQQITFVPGPAPGNFLIVSNHGSGADQCYTSEDAGSWSAVAASVPNKILALASYGRMAVMFAQDPVSGLFYDLFFSLDQGATWKRAQAFHLLNAAVGSALLVLGEKQFVINNSFSDACAVSRGIRGGT